MTLLPDSGDPGNEFDKLKLDQKKPELLTEATWRHLNAKYELRGELGKGGQALVLQVKERKAPHGRRAIKVYHENTDAAIRLFENESRVIASDHLPQDLVVGYYEAVRQPGIQPYLVLEFIDGETIADWSRRRMPVEHRIALWEKLLRALHRLHQCHLVFGDLSSKNVMVGRDDTIRFIDLAGAKPVKKAYSDSQSSINIGTAIAMPDAWKDGDARTALWTDIYAASATGLLILTGKDRTSVPPAQWEAELSDCGVPAVVRRIVLKGLREKDTTKTEDPTLYPSAEHVAMDISKWREGLVRRERRIRQTFVTALLVFAVGAIAFVGWQKYYEAVASADHRVLQSLQAEIRELPNLNHPAVTKLLSEEKSLLTERDDADARQDRAASRAATTQLIAKSRDILCAAREIDRAEQQRIAIGKLLLEDEATEKSGFWVTQAPAIATRLTQLQQRYRDIAQRVEAGKTEKLAPDLAHLQTDLAELFKVSLDARSAFEARLAYDRLRQLVPERLQSNDGFLTITSGSDQAEKSWANATWDGGQSLTLARQQFGLSTQQLTEWLPRNLTPEEQASIERDSRERVAELTAETASLRTTIDTQEAKINQLNQQIADLAGTHISIGKQLEKSKTELSAEQQSRTQAETKVTQLSQAATETATVQSAILATNASLIAGLLKRDAADQTTFDTLQQQIDSKQKQHYESHAKGTSLQSPEMVKLRTEIETLKQSKVLFFEGQQRAEAIALTAGRLKLEKLLKQPAISKPEGRQPRDSITGTEDCETREITLPGGVKQIYIWCPPTKEPFAMGTPGATDDESPVQVTLPQGFWLAQTETTQAQYTAIMGTSPWIEHGNTDYYKAGANFPASYITHTEAETYCAKLTEIERKAGRLPAGWKYALPTEAQWEYAARAGTTGAYSFDGGEEKLGDYAWFEKNAYYIGEKYAHTVGMKKPNPWGLKDVHGNLREWTRDAHQTNLPGGQNPFVDSTDQAANRVIRGGSWYDQSVYCRSAHRSVDLPSYRSNYLGFRPATVPVESVK